jgi:hypothetical protein
MGGTFSTHSEVAYAYEILVGNPEGRYRFGDLGIGGSLILKWILKKHDVRLCTGFVWLRLGTFGGLL